LSTVCRVDATGAAAAQRPACSRRLTAAPVRADRYRAWASSTLRRPSRPSHSSAAPVRNAETKFSSTLRCPRASDTTGDVALAFAPPSSGGGGARGVRSSTHTTWSRSTTMVPSDPVSSTRRGKPGNADVVERDQRSEEHTSELQSRGHLVCRLLLEKKNKRIRNYKKR